MNIDGGEQIFTIKSTISNSFQVCFNVHIFFASLFLLCHVVLSDYQVMRRNERAHFFSAKEQELILKLYEEERDILTAKSNTTSASKLREEAWQRIADKINT